MNTVIETAVGADAISAETRDGSTLFMPTPERDACIQLRVLNIFRREMHNLFAWRGINRHGTTEHGETQSHTIVSDLRKACRAVLALSYISPADGAQGWCTAYT